MSEKLITGPDRYHADVPIRNKQCLCCKQIIWQYHLAYAARIADGPNWICVKCYEQWEQRSDRPMFRLSRYREEGRIKGVGNDPLRAIIKA